jgi:hypothetical protein
MDAALVVALVPADSAGDQAGEEANDYILYERVILDAGMPK